MKTSTLTVMSVMLLSAALAQARKYVVLEAVASRTYPYLYETVEPTAENPNPMKKIAEDPPARTAGQSAMHMKISDDAENNVAYFENALKKFHDHVKTEVDGSVEIHVFATGGVRSLDEIHGKGSEELFWVRVRIAIQTFTKKNPKFKLGTTQTRTGVDEARFALDVAKRETNSKNAVMVWIGGVDLKVAYESGSEYHAEVFDLLGTVQASETYTTELARKKMSAVGCNMFARCFLDDVVDFQDYAEKTAELVAKDEKAPEDATEAQKTEVRQKNSKTLMDAVSKGGELAVFQGKISHPCLMKADNPLELVKFFNTFKDSKVTYREVVPFKGTGDYKKCFDSIVELIDRTVTPSKFSAPKSAPVVGLGTLYHNTNNLALIKIIAKSELKTVGDLAKASKIACEMPFSQAIKKYNEYKDEWDNKMTDAEKKKIAEKFITPHSLVELCWASTSSTVVLKHTLGLEESQPLSFARGGAAQDVARKIAREEL